MEPIYSNSCIFSKTILDEMNKTMTPKGYKIYCITFIFIFLFISVLSIIAGKSIIGLIFGICCLLIILIYFSRPKILAIMTYNNYMKLYGCEVKTKTFIYEDMIIGKNLKSNKTVQASYSDITSIAESKNLYVLMLHKNIALALFKNGFIPNDCLKFKEFIIRKMSECKDKS